MNLRSELPEPTMLPPQKKRRRRKQTRKSPKKRGRKRIKRKFEQTTLGHSLRLNAPFEYEAIIDAGGDEPLAELIEAVSYSSINPYFRTSIFRKLLIGYRTNGCFQRVPMPDVSCEDERKYLKIRKSRINKLKLENVR